MAHRYHVVLNNPTEVEQQIIDDQYRQPNQWWRDNRIKFIYYQKHEHQSTPHIHIYVEYSVMRKWQLVKLQIGFNRAHIEKCYDTRIKNILYIDNEGLIKDQPIIVDFLNE